MARVNDKQKECFVELMKENYGFLFGKHPTMTGELSKASKWTKITKLLNELGPPTRTTEQWKKVRSSKLFDCCLIEMSFNVSLFFSYKTWADMKSRVKEKSCLIRQQFHAGNQQPQLKLNELEKSIEAICGVAPIHGDSNLDELGFGEIQLMKLD